MQGESIKVKDLRQGMRVVEYGYGRRIISTALEDARRVNEGRGDAGHYDGWEARVRPDDPARSEFDYFECIEGSPYGPRIYRWEEMKEQRQLEVEIDGRVCRVEICYPRNGEDYHTVEVGLNDVRAADSVRVSYDFDRDGWKIEQASTFSWWPEDPLKDEDWQEVAFVPAWGRKKPGPGDDGYEEEAI